MSALSEEADPRGPHDTVHANGVNVNFHVTGAGAPVLLLAGLGQSSIVWREACRRLRVDRTVITLDNRGTGRSDAPPGPYSINELADDAAALLEHLKLGAVSVVGWSLGGAILQAMLIRYPMLLERAVVVSAMPRYTELQHAWLDSQLTLRRSAVDPLSIRIQGMAWGFTQRLLQDHDRVVALARAAEQDPFPTSVAAFEAQAAGIREFDVRSQLHRVRTPTLVMCGAEDILTPISHSIELAGLIESAELRVLPRGGHGMLAEYPDDTLDAIQRFLDVDS